MADQENQPDTGPTGFRSSPASARQPQPTQAQAPRVAQAARSYEGQWRQGGGPDAPQFSPMVSHGLGEFGVTIAWPMIQFLAKKGLPYVLAFVKDLIAAAEAYEAANGGEVPAQAPR